MPYANMPKSTWGKMERCTKDVGGKGNKKYAICYTSIIEKLKKNKKK